jgi:hypothetical protein
MLWNALEGGSPLTTLLLLGVGDAFDAGGLVTPVDELAVVRRGPERGDSAGREAWIWSYTVSSMTPFSSRFSSSCHFKLVMNN